MQETIVIHERPIIYVLDNIKPYEGVDAISIAVQLMIEYLLISEKGNGALLHFITCNTSLAKEHRSDLPG